MKKFISRKLSAVPQSYKHVAKNSALLFGLRAVQRALGLVSLYFIVRAVDQTAYGQYQFILSIVGFLCISALPGLGDAATQSIARGHLGTYRITQYYAFGGSIIGALFLLGLAGWYAFGEDNAALGAGFALAAAIFPFAKGLLQWNALKTGREHFFSYVLWEGGVAIVMQIFIIAGVLMFKGTFLVPLLFVLLIPALQNLYLTAQAYRQISKEAEVEEGSLAYGFKTTLYALPFMAAQHIEKILLFTFLSPASLALYAAAEKIPELAKNLIQDIGAVLAPRLARQRGYTAQIDKVFKYFSWVAGACILVAAFTIVPWFFVLLFGEEYKAGVPYVMALMCAVAVGNQTILRERFIRSQMDARSMRDMNLIMAFTRIVAVCILVPLYGIMGAVMGVFITRFVNVIAVHIILRKRYAL